MKERGVTLVALVITIIILLILAGIAINLAIGERGIITTAKQGAQNYINAQNAEIEGLNQLDKEVNDMLDKHVNMGNIKDHLPIKKMIYLDSVNGNDSTGNGEITNPYQTILKAIQEINSDNTAIVLKNGTYNLECLVGKLGETSYHNIYWIGDYESKGEVIINLTSDTGSGKREMNHHTFINIVFNRTGGDSRVLLDYTFDGSVWNLDLYNCVIKGRGAESAVAYFANSNMGPSSGSLNLYHCLILNSSSISSQHEQHSEKWVNCALQSSFSVRPSDVEIIDSVGNIRVDEFYQITNEESIWKNVGTGTNPDGSKANLGVYGGEFSW